MRQIALFTTDWNYELVGETLRGVSASVITSDFLGKTYHAEERFEEPDGSAYILDTDYFGNARPQANPMPGPFEISGDEAVTFRL